MEHKKSSKKKHSRPQHMARVNNLAFNGPIRTRGEANEVHSTVQTWHEVTQLTSTSVGLVILTINMNPSTAADRVAIGGVYTEYRLLGCRVEYHPYNRYTRGTVSTGNVFVYSDHLASSNIAGTNTEAMAYESVKVFSLDDPWFFEWRANGLDEMTFRNTLGMATDGTQGHIFIFNGWNPAVLSNSVKYGDLLIYWKVELRGRY